MKFQNDAPCDALIQLDEIKLRLLRLGKFSKEIFDFEIQSYNLFVQIES